MSNFQFQTTESGVAVLTFDLKNEKVNKITSAVGEELEIILKELSKRSDISGLVFISGKPDLFVAGADINEILSIRVADEGRRKSEEAQKLPNLIEMLPFPTVAAIHGACLGGGCELALGFKYRIATDHPKTKIGLPEVQLGILPGMGGCNRLPTLIGLRSSLAMILAGDSWPALKCLKTGLVDEVVPPEILYERAIEVIEKKQWKKVKREKFSLLNLILEKNRVGRNFVYKKARENILKKTGGHYPAPLKALDTIYECLDRGLTDGLKIEAEAFGSLSDTDVSKNLIQLFFLSEAAKKQSGVSDSTIRPKRIERSAVLGAGVMGAGIAQLLSYRDISVRFRDMNERVVGKGLSYARSLYQGLVNRKKMTPRELEQKMALISPTTDYSGFKRLDIVIEAVVEDLEVKQKVFLELEAKVSPETILASNTSSLSIKDIAAKCEHKERVVGMHFFNPVHKMPLVEVVVDPITSFQTIVSTVALAKDLGKVPVVVKNAPGFLVNRILMPYMNEAAYLLEEGISAKTLDGVMVHFGMPMGPFTLLDAVGIDVAEKVSKILHKAFGDRMKPNEILNRVVQAGYYGNKNNKGFYQSPKKRERVENQAIYSVIGIRPKTQDLVSEEWQHRMVFQMVHEAIRCLSEGIVQDVQDLDLALIFGIGFPPFRGGLLRYADQIGLDKVLSELEIFSRRYGERFHPPEYLRRMVETGRRFYGD